VEETTFSYNIDVHIMYFTTILGLEMVMVNTGSIFANPPKIGTMGSRNPPNFLLLILYEICSNFCLGHKSLK
jgi:hypothetical protein